MKLSLTPCRRDKICFSARDGVLEISDLERIPYMICFVKKIFSLLKQKPTKNYALSRSGFNGYLDRRFESVLAARFFVVLLVRPSRIAFEAFALGEKEGC